MNLNIIMAVKGERQPRGFAFGRTAPCIKNEPTIIQAGPNFSNRAITMQGDPGLGGTSGFGPESADGNCTLADRRAPAKAGRGH